MSSFHAPRVTPTELSPAELMVADPGSHHGLNEQERVRWYRVRLGSLSIESYRAGSSRKIKAKGARQDNRRNRTAPPGFRERFLTHLSIFSLVALFMIASASLWSMQSRAIVGRVVSTPIIDVSPTPEHSEESSEEPGARATAPRANAIKSNKPAAPYSPGARQSFAITQAADPAGNMSSSQSNVVASTGFLSAIADSSARQQSSFSAIPAVRQAINRAAHTGEMQNWSHGQLDGFVVAGAAYTKDKASCRRISILARDGGFDGQTEALEHCSIRQP